MENIEFEKIDNEFEYASLSFKIIINQLTAEHLKMQIEYEKSKQLHLQEKLKLKNKILELQDELINIYFENSIIDVEIE